MKVEKRAIIQAGDPTELTTYVFNVLSWFIGLSIVDLESCLFFSLMQGQKGIRWNMDLQELITSLKKM